MESEYFKLEPVSPMTDGEMKAFIEKDGDCKLNIEYLTVKEIIERYGDLLTEEQIKSLKHESLDKN